MKYKTKLKNKTHFIKIKNKIASSTLHFGSIGLISLKNGYIDQSEFESCKKNILKRIKSKGKLITKTYPFLGVTSKPIAIRMGKGKGMISTWTLPAKRSTVLFEIICTEDNLLHIKWALGLASNSLSLPTKIITKQY